MARFVITPRFRLHEWVAEEKGYFRDEGLDYEFREVFKTHATPDRVGAMTSFEQGRDTNVSCACHWTVNVAASQGRGKMYADAYSISPGGVFVPPESPIRTPQDLRNVPISVGHQSGSHYSTMQALEQYLPRNEIKLSFADGILFGRMEKLIDRKVPAAALFSGPTTSPSSSVSQGHRYDVHDRLDDHRRSGPRRRAQVFPRAAPRAARHQISGPSFIRTTTRKNSRSASAAKSTRGAGGRASASCSSPTRARSSRSPSSGSPSAKSSRPGPWARANTTRLVFR